MEAKQAAALGPAMSRLGLAGGDDSPPPSLLPFPSPSRARLELSDVLKRIAAWVIALQLGYLLATAVLVAFYRSIDPPVTVLMAYREWAFGWRVQAPRPVQLKRIPRYIRSMLISVEDGKFYVHHGIDLEAIRRAREINKRLGRPLYGGSTLTMQVARTLFLVPVKSYLRKYLELLTALELEALLPKDRILELYFGYAEWGKGIFGMEAAARRWYGRGVSALSRDEAARLIAILSSPVKYGPETLQRNGILRERYRYLTERFNPQPQAEPPIETPVESPAETPAETEAPPPADAPPPSPEPDTDLGPAAAAQ